jgi:hypothetical protein
MQIFVWCLETLFQQHTCSRLGRLSCFISRTWHTFAWNNCVKLQTSVRESGTSAEIRISEPPKIRIFLSRDQYLDRPAKVWNIVRTKWNKMYIYLEMFNHSVEWLGRMLPAPSPFLTATVAPRRMDPVTLTSSGSSRAWWIVRKRVTAISHRLLYKFY